MTFFLSKQLKYPSKLSVFMSKNHHTVCPIILPFLNKIQENFEPFKSFPSFVKK